jgi:cytochrome c oxidase cbb3-type subunit 3
MALRFAAVRNRGTALLFLALPGAFGTFGTFAKFASLARTLVPAAVAAVIVTGTVACSQAPAAESLPEWTPADHRSNDDDKLAMRQGQAQAAGRAGAQNNAKVNAAPDRAQMAQLVDITWRQQCSNCHGLGGRGDGQMGPMLHATDLTNGDWQGRTSDAEMAASIKAGKNRMPRFDLPDTVIAGLVARIRALRASP